MRSHGTLATPKSNRTEFESTVQVFRDGDLLDTIRTKRAFYPSFNMASTNAAIRSTPVEDLYIVPSENLPDGSVGFRILVNPLIWWMWVAGPVMVLGTVIALWPQKIRAPAPVPSPRRFASAPRRAAASRRSGRCAAPGAGPRRASKRRNQPGKAAAASLRMAAGGSAGISRTVRPRGAHTQQHPRPGAPDDSRSSFGARR